jgi:hypothetical protein
MQKNHRDVWIAVSQLGSLVEMPPRRLQIEPEPVPGEQRIASTQWESTILPVAVMFGLGLERGL